MSMMNRHNQALLALVLVGCAVLLTGCATTRPVTAEERVPAVWPINHPKRAISSNFGARRSTGGSGGFHKGIDISAPKGTPVYATATGKVVHAKRAWWSGYGRLVQIDHGNGYETWYAHLSSIGTRKGRLVRQGERIGKVGNSGRSTGPHLHYEVRKSGTPVDPRPYMK